MRELPIDAALYNEAMLSDELPDAVLEAAAAKCSELAGNPFTLAFCSGLDSCPRRVD
jgi:hypothetical protein